MEKTADYAEITASRKDMYRLLGRIYKIEADQILLDQMKGMEFPAECDTPELVRGFRMLEEYLRDPGRDPLTDLAVDYARVFLGAGQYESIASAYPYESVYTSPKRLMMQDARDQVVAIYRSKGLKKAEALDFPEDHIALELEFMAYLCQETQRALDQREWPLTADNFKEQADFLTHHLLNWAPAFCADIEKYAETKFYQAIAQVTRGFLHLEQTTLVNLIAETTAENAYSR